MKHLNDETIDRLASEYVIGTLKGKAKLRFEKLMSAHPSIKHRVNFWEEHFSALAVPSEEIQPSKKVWRNIEKALDRNAEPGKVKSSGWLWPTWSALSALCLVFLIAVYIPTLKRDATIPFDPPSHLFSKVAVVGESTNPEWVISADLSKGVITARAVNAQAATLDRVFELWMLPDDGVPRSLGLLPVNGERAENVLPPALIALLETTAGLAVSIEPPGGSPTGAPTGDVVFMSRLSRL